MIAANVFGADVKGEIESRNKAWTDVFNRGDLKSVSAIYDDDFLAIPGGGEAITDRAEFEQILVWYYHVDARRTPEGR